MALAIERKTASIDHRHLLAALFVAAISITLFWPAYAFSVDESIYLEMARAMAEHGSLSIAPANPVPDAPAVTRTFTHVVDGAVMPQYPSGFALVGAPFYLLMGARGLVLLNVLSSVLAAWLTYRTGRHLFDDASVARNGTALLVAGTFFSTYVFGIWPHMLSLALLMGASERLAWAAGQNGQPRMIGFLTAGVLLGAGLNIRADFILAIIASLIWVRLFASPSRRLDAGVFLTGLVPGLLLAVALNYAKFGVFSPLAYGPVGDDTLMAKYQLQMLALGAFILPLLSLDFGRPWATRISSLLHRPVVIASITALGLAAILAIGPIRQIVWNMWVLVGDLQMLDRDKVGPTASDTVSGFLTYWDMYKLALLQSVPVLALAGVAAIALIRNQSPRSIALCLGMIAGPVLFYSLTQWHGGFSLNMRYFLPALPFACLLTGFGLTWLQRRHLVDGGTILTAVKIGIAASLAAVMVFTTGMPRILLSYYYPLLLATALVWFLAWTLANRRARMARLGLSTVIGLSFAWGAAASMEDVLKLNQRLTYHASLSDPYDDVLPEGGLVFASIEELMATASLSGTHVAVMPDTVREIMDLTTAYNEAGRCVFIHTGEQIIETLKENGMTSRPVVTRERPSFMLSLYRLGDIEMPCSAP